MAESKLTELRPVEHITTDAIGAPGKRVFYVQAQKGMQSVSLIVEKFQIESLAAGVEQFMAELDGQRRSLSPASADYNVEQMRIQPPVDALFRVGQVGLAYDEVDDLMALEMRELVTEGEKPDAATQQVARFWCTRSQMRALVNWGLEVVAHGRPLCPQCGEPTEAEGHLCAKKNGHKV
jgi:uncharacterized repeat protein (TIGR03847 family)